MRKIVYTDMSILWFVFKSQYFCCFTTILQMPGRYTVSTFSVLEGASGIVIMQMFLK